MTIHLAALRGPVTDILERDACFRDLVAAGRVHHTVPDAVDALGYSPLGRRPRTEPDRGGHPGRD